MSCHQEDPYIFTDTLSNSTSFMHDENNSQTKYVPLNRQTIYNRQFRQHEPTISSDSNGRKTSPKIIISPSSQKHERKNGSSATITTSTKTSFITSRTLPKVFKSPADELNDDEEKDDDKSKVREEISLKNHSIASQSVYKKEELRAKSESGINGIIAKITTTTTGIKQEISYEGEEESENEEAQKQQKFKRVHRRNQVRTHSSQKNVTVEPISEIPRNTTLDLDLISRNYLLKYTNNENSILSRNERLKMKKLYLQHLVQRHKGLHQARKDSLMRSRHEFMRAHNLWKKINHENDEKLKNAVKKCFRSDCNDKVIFTSDFCGKHIVCGEREQFLIRQCCFLHDNGQQCRVPVYDILATVAVCNDHLNASPHQLITAVVSNSSINNSSINNTFDSMKPKKPQLQRKRTKTNSQLIRPVKKSGSSCGGKQGRKKKISASTIKFTPLSNSNGNNNMTIPAHRPTMIIHPSDIQRKSIATLAKSLPQKHESVLESNQFIHHNSGNLLASSQSSYGSMSNSGNEDLYLKQDLMTAVCENSYESSEDTGVGGLSENELMSNDVIANFDMESCAELSKVLSSLPSNTLDDILTEPLHTSRDDEEYLDRAIEEVSASGMDQIAITAFGDLEGLDMLEMLDDEEQRQMISAATNLISMSGYMSHEQDNNYSAMPSPMMS